MLFDRKANEKACAFLRKAVMERLKDPEKQRLLTPKKQPRPCEMKRNSFERRFYEVVDRHHVKIISISENPVEEVTGTGLRTTKGLAEVDVS